MTDPELINLAVLQRSNLCGYWLRLKSLGYVRGTERSLRYKRKGSPHVYVRIFWEFHAKSQPSNRVVFGISPHGYSMQVVIGEAEQLNLARRCWSHLEVPFLEYFEETRPLQINRLGPQRPEVVAYQHAQAVKAAKAARLAKAKKGK